MSFLQVTLFNLLILEVVFTTYRFCVFYVNNDQTLDITCYGKGKNSLFFGDSEGGVTVCDQSYLLYRFLAHDTCINYIYQVFYKNQLLLYFISQCKDSGFLYTFGNCKDLRSEHVVNESKKSANHYRSLLQRNDSFSLTLDTMMLSDEVVRMESMTPLPMELKVWKLSTADRMPQCLRTITLFQKIEEENITSYYVCEEEEMILLGSEKGHIFYLQVFFSNYK